MVVKVVVQSIMRERIQLVVKLERKNLSVHHLAEEEVVVEEVEVGQALTEEEEEEVADRMVEVMVDEEEEEEEVEVKVEELVAAVILPVEIKEQHK